MYSKSILLIGNHFSGQTHNQNAWQDLANHLRFSGYDVIITSAKQNKLLRFVDMLGTILKRRRDYTLAEVDVFSGQAFTWAYFCGHLLKIIKKPFILTLHGGNLPQFSKRHPVMVRWLLEEAYAVTAPSRYLQMEMRKYRDDISLIPNALDLAHYPFLVRSNPQPKLIWLRAFHEIYNPKMAVEVLQHLIKQFPNVKLTMVGPDKEDGSFQKTKALAAQYGLQDKVQYPGGISKTDVPGWLNKGDIFINTTNFDNTPISVMEAMACGLCVVCTNVGGIPYLLEDGVDALLAPPNDPDAMAAAVRQILTEPGLAGRLSINARKKAEQFDWENIFPQWEKLIQSIL